MIYVCKIKALISQICNSWMHMTEPSRSSQPAYTVIWIAWVVSQNGLKKGFRPVGNLWNSRLSQGYAFMSLHMRKYLVKYPEEALDDHKNNVNYYSKAWPDGVQSAYGRKDIMSKSWKVLQGVQDWLTRMRCICIEKDYWESKLYKYNECTMIM